MPDAAMSREFDPTPTPEAGQAVDRLIPLVYDELRRLAAKILQGEQTPDAVQATSLVHEVYLRLLGQRQVRWQDRTHFFRIAARIMRRVLVDTYRARHALKRGGGFQVTLLDAAANVPSEPVDVLALDDLLTDLAKLSSTQASIVELRYFVGFTLEETAAALDISVSTVKRDWALAKAWIFLQLRQRPDGESA